MRNQLLRGDLVSFGKSLDIAWQNKRKLSIGISNNQLDKIYDDAISHGALGGKLLGAGGGGFFIFFVPPLRKFELIKHLKESSLNIRPFRFEQEGLRSWTVRETRD